MSPQVETTLAMWLYKRARTFALATLLYLPAFAISGPHEQATEEMQKGNYAIAYHLWLPLANSGDIEACYSLGWMYHNGYGLAINDGEAEKYWQLAAVQGHTGALFALGNLYSLGGKDVSQDYERAMNFWAQAAVLGHRDAGRALLQLAEWEVPGVDAKLMDLLVINPRLFDSTGKISADRVNLRRGPGTDHRIIEVLDRDKPVIELLRRDSWVKVGISDPPQMGWVHGDLIRPGN